MEKITFLNAPLHAITMDETLEFIQQRINKKIFTQHAVVNVAKLVHMQSDHELTESLKACDVINIDGMGVIFGARLLGYKIPERVAGIDLFYNLLDMSAKNNFPIFLLGAKEDIVGKTVQKIQALYPDIIIAGYHHGYFWDDETALVDKIKLSGAKLLFVAIASPKKENFINQWKKELGVDFVMGVGGTFDVVAGKVKRAPVWMQEYGLEWFYRVIQEPRRMWKRYLVTNCKFAYLLAKEKLGVN